MVRKRVQPHKIKAVDSLTALIGEAKDFIFADYRGMTVEQFFILRRELRKEQAECKVVKNSFAKIVFQHLKVEKVAPYLVGPTAVTIIRQDSGPVAKILVEYAKGGASLQVKGGFIGGILFNAEQLVAYSKLPERKELLALLMSTMQAPIQNLVYVFNGIATKLVRTLEAYRERRTSEIS